MDIVYPIKKTVLNEELRYSLRSLQNIKHDKVFIVGDCPSFINDETVFYIPTNKFISRYETTTNNIKVACECDELSDNFILMNDDFFILNPIIEEDLKLNRGLLREQVKFYHKNHYPLTNYDRLVEKATSELIKQGFENPVSYELHAPIIINKKNFLSILNKINNEALHCCKRSVYGNYFIKEGKTIDDVKVLNRTNFRPEIQGKYNVLSVSEACWGRIKPFISSKFPTKSIYER